MQKEKDPNNKNKDKSGEEITSISHDSLFEFKSIGTVDNKQEDSVSKKDKLTDILMNSPLKENDEILIQEDQNNEVLFDEQTIKTNEKVADTFSLTEVKSVIESALYVCGNEGLGLNDLKHLTDLPANIIKKIMKEWIDQLNNDDSRGISIKIFGDKYKFFSKPYNREKLSKLITIKYRNPLSTKVMETLAIIAYNQPCTKSIIQDIRTKDPTSSIERLLDVGLIVEAGRADSPGRPLLFTVTHKFYDIFGIKNLNDLPVINLMQPFQDEDVSFFDTNRFDE